MQAKSQGTAVNNLLLRDLRTAVAALPPLEEQKEIVKEIEQYLSIISELAFSVNKSAKRAERLRQSILKKAFLGTLVQ
jgi:type I restriction enzyme S subunit